MRKYVLLLMITAVLCSCNRDDADVSLEIDLIGDWKLIQMTGSIANSETTGIEMDWQETYRLNSDGTFQKSRVADGITTEVSGTYSTVGAIEGLYLEFIFDEVNRFEFLRHPSYGRTYTSLISQEKFAQDIEGYTAWIQTAGIVIKCFEFFCS